MTQRTNWDGTPWDGDRIDAVNPVCHERHIDVGASASPWHPDWSRHVSLQVIGPRGGFASEVLLLSPDRARQLAAALIRQVGAITSGGGGDD